jgi:4'-phosphopantetheinyl transferase EntD
MSLANRAATPTWRADVADQGYGRIDTRDDALVNPQPCTSVTIAILAAMHPELSRLFPPSVRVVELSDPARAEPLYPIEEQAIERAVEKRKIEFALGRTAARKALAQLGIAHAPLAHNADRSVAWPSLAWGSITHADGMCAAIASLRRDHAGIGIDAEVRGRVRRDLWHHIATKGEIAWFDAAADERQKAERATLLFSAKEAFYKAQFCVSQAWVGFHDVALRCDERDGFEVEMLVDVGTSFARGQRFLGRYAFLPAHVVTGVALAPA